MEYFLVSVFIFLILRINSLKFDLEYREQSFPIYLGRFNPSTAHIIANISSSNSNISSLDLQLKVEVTPSLASSDQTTSKKFLYVNLNQRLYSRLILGSAGTSLRFYVDVLSKRSMFKAFHIQVSVQNSDNSHLPVESLFSRNSFICTSFGYLTMAVYVIKLLLSTKQNSIVYLALVLVFLFFGFLVIYGLYSVIGLTVLNLYGEDYLSLVNRAKSYYLGSFVMLVILLHYLSNGYVFIYREMFSIPWFKANTAYVSVYAFAITWILTPPSSNEEVGGSFYLFILSVFEFSALLYSVLKASNVWNQYNIDDLQYEFKQLVALVLFFPFTPGLIQLGRSCMGTSLYTLAACEWISCGLNSLVGLKLAEVLHSLGAYEKEKEKSEHKV